MRIKFFQVRFCGQVMLETIRLREAQEFFDDLFNDEKRNPGHIVPELWEDSREAVDHTVI